MIVEGNRVIRIDAALELVEVASYDTVQVALDRRFTRGFLLQASFDYQWRDEFRSAAEEARSPLVADPLVVGSGGHGRIWRNHSLDVGARQATTAWGACLLVRYVLPRGVGLSANVRHQSGWPYAPIQRVDIPGTGTGMPVFLTDPSANRSEGLSRAGRQLAACRTWARQSRAEATWHLCERRAVFLCSEGRVDRYGGCFLAIGR